MDDVIIDEILGLVNGTSFDYKLIETVIKKLSSFGYSVTENDLFALAFSIQKVDRSIKNSCNTMVIPEGLYNTSVDRVCGEFLFAKKQTGQLDSTFNFETAVKQIQMGDTNITYAIGDGSQTMEQRIDALISVLMNSGEGEMACYRKIKW